jgi:demethylspheroidene O-methyltransferase
MAASQSLIADEVLDAWPLGQRRCLLDVGGGEGAFLAAAAQRHPQLRLMLFDLPAVAERARERLQGVCGSDRARVFGGSFLADPLPQGADVISLVRVLHDHDDEAVRVLLRAVRLALAPGGELIVAEPMAATAGAQTMGEAYFGIYLLAMGSGRPRTAERLTELLHDAGFATVRAAPTRLPIQTRVLVARSD